MKKWILIFFYLTVVISCRKNSKNSYSISDFNTSHRKYLQRMVTQAIFDYDTTYKYIEKNLTPTELKKLSKSEHPILRLAALEIIKDKNKGDHYALINDFLDDTAIVIVDEGEFGQNLRKIADVIFNRSEWRSSEQIKKTREKIILKHNNLSEAYENLKKIPAEERFYQSVREMANRLRPFHEIEWAIYKLAEYRKTGDIELIKKIMLANIFRMGSLCFKLMEEFPNPAYIEVLNKFRSLEFPQRRFPEFVEGGENLHKEFLTAFMSYKNDSSASALKQIIRKFETPSDCYNRKSIFGILYSAIQKYPSFLHNIYIPQIIRLGNVDTSRQIILITSNEKNRKFEETEYENIYYWR